MLWMYPPQDELNLLTLQAMTAIGWKQYSRRAREVNNAETMRRLALSYSE